MKKETIIALLLGLLTGGTIAILIIFTAREKNIKEKKVIATKIKPSIITTQTQKQPLEIIEPKNDSVAEKKSISVKGKTEKNATIFVQSQQGEQIAVTKDNSFDLTVPLGYGENTIEVASYQDGIVEEKKITVFYLDK